MTNLTPSPPLTVRRFFQQALNHESRTPTDIGHFRDAPGGGSVDELDPPRELAPRLSPETTSAAAP